MISISKLSYRYPNNPKDTIKDVSFTTYSGEIFGLLGPSGAGKSTIQKLLTGILKGYRGSITVANQELAHISNQFYNKIGVVFEVPNLYSKFTALENLHFFSKLYDNTSADPLELLTMVNLSQDANTRISDYSKGMKMRLNFCRAFLHNPEILFLDEPTSGLDPVNAKKIKQIILDNKTAGKTIFLTTHNMSVVDDICDRIGFIVNGQLALVDTPRNLEIRKGKGTVIVEYLETGGIVCREFQLIGLGDNPEFIKLLKTNHIQRIHTQEATLEDIFIEVTGQHLE